MGLTNSTHNLFGSFQQTEMVKSGEWEFKTIHFDEIALKGKHIDDFAQQIYDKTKPDVILVTFLGLEKSNPSEKFFQVFKNAGCKIIVLWPDYGRDWTIQTAARFDRFIDSNVAIACEKNGNFPKTKWLWTPEDPTYFYFDGFDKKDIDVSFLGTIHSSERAEYINFLKQYLPSDIKVHFGGGQRHEKLSAEKYAEITRRSKMIINFPWSVAGNDQLKGRVFEAISCGALLLERKNDRTKEFFEPKKDYAEYTSKEHLLKMINDLHKDQTVREIVALSGLEKFKEQWNQNKFWEQVLLR